jgi:hypothetical protein
MTAAAATPLPETATPIESVAVGPPLERIVEIYHRGRTPVLFVGPGGIGKSECVKCKALGLGIGFVCLNLALMEPSDLLGIPFVRGGVTRWAPPSCLPRRGSGILMLEDMNRAERHVLQPLLQLITERRLNDYRLPDGWTIVAAANPETAEYDVTPLDRAFRTRFVRVAVHADRTHWLAWATAHDVHPTILGVVRAHDQALLHVPPRVWTLVSRVLHAMTLEERLDVQCVRDAIGGTLPAAWLELVVRERVLHDDPLDARALLRGYDRDPALQGSVQRDLEAGRTDRIHRAYREIHSIVAAPGVADGGVRLAAFERLLPDLPGDLRDALQDVFGDQPRAAARLLDFDPALALAGYGRSPWRRSLRAWRADPMLAHRLRAVVRALVDHVESADLAGLRSAPTRRSLGHLLRDLGAQRSAPLLEALRKRGVPLPLPRGWEEGGT